MLQVLYSINMNDFQCIFCVSSGSCTQRMLQILGCIMASQIKTKLKISCTVAHACIKRAVGASEIVSLPKFTRNGLIVLIPV